MNRFPRVARVFSQPESKVMNKLVLMSIALFGGALSAGEADAACDAWSAAATRAYTSTYCSCGSASGSASYRPAGGGLPGDAAGRINSGNNSLNDIQIKVRCYNDAGSRYADYSSTWDDGNYVFRACPSSQPLATRAWCRIRPD
jgi:hypothetical protein